MANKIGTILGNLHRPVAYLLESLGDRAKYKGDGSDIGKFYSAIEREVSDGDTPSWGAFICKRPTLSVLAVPLFAAALSAWINTRQFIQKIVRGIGWVAGGAGVLAIVGGIICEFINKGSNGESGGGRRDEPPPGPKPPPDEPPPGFRVPERVSVTAPKFEDAPTP